LGRADTIQLRSLKAKSVLVVVESDAAAAYGDLIAVGRVAEAVKAPGSCDWG